MTGLARPLETGWLPDTPSAPQLMHLWLHRNRCLEDQANASGIVPDVGIICTAVLSRPSPRATRSTNRSMTYYGRRPMPATQRYCGHPEPIPQGLLRDARHKHVRSAYRERGHGGAVSPANDRIVSIDLVRNRCRDSAPGRPSPQG